MCSMKQGVVRARIEKDLKAEASAVLESCGLGLSDAIRIFLRQVVKQGGLPFPVRARHVVSGDQIRKMKRASQQRDRKLAANEDVSAGEMLLISPDRMRNAQIAWPDIELKLPTSVKKAATELAAPDGVSLNQSILVAVAEKVCSLRGADDTPCE